MVRPIDPILAPHVDLHAQGYGFTCRFCHHSFANGNIRRIRSHLGKFSGMGFYIGPCLANNDHNVVNGARAAVHHQMGNNWPDEWNNAPPDSVLKNLRGQYLVIHPAPAPVGVPALPLPPAPVGEPALPLPPAPVGEPALPLAPLPAGEPALPLAPLPVFSPIDRLAAGLKLIEYEPFVPRLASCILLYVRIADLVVSDQERPPAAVDSAGILSSFSFKDLLVSYRHTNMLVTFRNTLSDEEFSEAFDLNDVDLSILCPKYKDLVQYVINQETFWASAKLFLQRIKPLIKVVSTYAVCSSTIGHLYRSFKSALVGFTGNQISDLGNYGEVLTAVSGTVFRAAAYMDPTFGPDSPGYDRAVGLSSLREFGDTYVPDNDRELFHVQAAGYFDRDEKYFSQSEVAGGYKYHPAGFWALYGPLISTFRRYAVKCVAIQATNMTEEQLHNLFSTDEEMTIEEVRSLGFQVYKESTEEEVDSYVIQNMGERFNREHYMGLLNTASDECMRCMAQDGAEFIPREA